MAKTLHVFRSDGEWKIVKEGEPVRSFRTRGEAISTAVQSGKRAKSSQVVVYAPSGRPSVLQSRGLFSIQAPPKKGRLSSRKIATAVGTVVLNRLKAVSEQSAQG